MSSPRINAAAVLSATEFVALMNAVFGSTLPLDPTSMKVHLFTGSPALSPATTLADLVALEPTYSGYVPLAYPTVSGAYVGEDGRAEVDASAVITFTGPAGGGGPTVTGFFVTDSGSTALLFSGKFNAPYSLIDDTSILHFVPSVYFPFNSNA
jgi:hypothetical protein